jgi:hypothetical protein
LFGLDFMLARDGSPALIEINTSPALFRHGAVLRRTLPLMMEEVCRLTLDRVFPPPTGHDRVESTEKGEVTRDREKKEKARFRELDVVVDLAVESSGSAVRARRSSGSPEKIKKQPVPRAATRTNTRVVSFGKGVGSDPAA